MHLLGRYLLIVEPCKRALRADGSQWWFHLLGLYFKAHTSKLVPPLINLSIKLIYPTLVFLFTFYCLLGMLFLHSNATYFPKLCSSHIFLWSLEIPLTLNVSCICDWDYINLQFKSKDCVTYLVSSVLPCITVGNG
jgi:hypothetical protein